MNKLQQLQQAQFARLAATIASRIMPNDSCICVMLEEVVQDDLRLFVALDLDDDAHAVAVAFVANVGDAVDFLVLDQLGDVLRSAATC